MKKLKKIEDEPLILTKEVNEKIDEISKKIKLCLLLLEKLLLRTKLMSNQ